MVVILVVAIVVAAIAVSVAVAVFLSCLQRSCGRSGEDFVWQRAQPKFCKSDILAAGSLF